MPPKPSSKPASAPSKPAPTDPAHPSTPALSSKELRMSYRIARGEQGVLTFEPYKSLLLPHWRFKDATAARQSSRTLHKCFDAYCDAGDFVGADMARKFIQMGMTRAKRYANHRGGRKYTDSSRTVVKERGKETEDMREKQRASDIFRKVWEECRADKRYNELREGWVAERAAWVEEGGDDKSGEEEGSSVEDTEAKRKKKRR